MTRNSLIAAALFGALVGLLFRASWDAPATRTPVNFLASGVNGAIIAAAMTGAHLALMRHGSGWLRRRPLAVELAIDGGVMVAVAVAVQVFAETVVYGNPLKEMPAVIPGRVALALAMSVAFLAVAHIVRLIGPGQFMSVLAGRYRRPVEEARVFLFLDLKDSTRLAERLGPVKVAALIARFFHDVDEAIARAGGEVQAYIGDEVIVSWPLDAALRGGACIACVRAIRARIAALGDSYAREFGLVPDFRAVLHGGPVVVSEIGRTRQQIGQFGDVVNATARLEELAKQLDRDFLISGDLLDRIDLPAGIAAQPLGEVGLRGRAAPMRVAALTEKEDGPARGPSKLD